MCGTAAKWHGTTLLPANRHYIPNVHANTCLATHATVSKAPRHHIPSPTPQNPLAYPPRARPPHPHACLPQDARGYAPDAFHMCIVGANWHALTILVPSGEKAKSLTMHSSGTIVVLSITKLIPVS